MEKFIHIAFGDSAAGTLKYFFAVNGNKYDGRIIGFNEDYSIGPVNGIDSEEGLKTRIEWFKDMLTGICADEYLDYFEKDFMDTYEELNELPMDSEIVLWHGKNTSDQVGLRYLCALLGNRSLHEVDVSTCFEEARDGVIKQIRALGECRPEEIKEIIMGLRSIDDERLASLTDDWKNIGNSNGKLRIFVDGCIVDVEENYYDKEILSNCSTEFQKAARVIGRTMGEADQLVGDAFIDFRLRKLIENGEIEHRGKLVTMRDFEVRLP